jgi:phage terminase large subunit
MSLSTPVDNDVLRVESPRVFKPLLAKGRYKGAFGGRGSAKSHFFAGQAVKESIRMPTDIICIRETQRSLKESCKKLIEMKIEALNAGAYFEVQDKRILSRCRMGETTGQIIFEGLANHTATSIKSYEGYRIFWSEESQDLSQKSIDILRPTARHPEAQMWFSWNPCLLTDPIDVLLRGKEPPPDSIVIEANWQDNPWFPDNLRQEMEYDRRRDPDKYAHIWQGHYQRNSEARVFRNWTVEEFEPRAGTVFRLGADWGFATDPSVLVRCWIDGNRLYVDQEAYGVGVEIVNLPAMFMSIPEAEKWPIVADSARPETISHMRNHGFPKIYPAIKGTKSLEDGVAFLQSFDIIVHPRCKHLIDELSLYCYKTDPLTNLVTPILQDKDNHVIDALRYACEGARRVAAQKPKAVKVPERMVWAA